MPASPKTFQASATVQINSLAQQKKARGERIYNLSAGEPILNSGHFYKATMSRILDEGKTLYPPTAGLDALRKTAADWMNRHHQTDYNAANTMVTPGGKFALHLAMQSLLNPGDEVLLPSPHYLSYPPMLELVGAKAILVHGQPETEWKITPKQLAERLTPNTKMLILNSGCNPTGIVYSSDEIAAIMDFAQTHDLWVLSDEVYSGLVYDGKSYASCATPASTRDKVAIVQSASKHFGMTGWRLGFLFGPESLIASCTALQSQTVTSTSVISQWAALAAFEQEDQITPWIHQEMQSRRDLFFAHLNSLLGLNLPRPAAAFYAFLPISIFTSQPISDLEFCEKVMENANVAIVPGSPFGRADHVRFSFGETEQELKEALDVLVDYCKRAL